MFPRHGKLLPPFPAKLRSGNVSLTNLLKGGPRVLEWTAAAQDFFQKVKQLLAAAVPLQHPSPTAKLSLATDASDIHIGSVMQQKSGTH
jgi:hypothetical protein